MSGYAPPVLRSAGGRFARGPWLDLALLVVLAAVAVALPSLRATAVVLAAGVVTTADVTGRGRIAAAAGFLVPVEVIDGLNSDVLLAGLIAVLLLVCIAYPSTVDRDHRQLVIVIVGLVVVTANVQRIQLLFEGSASSAAKAAASITIGCVAAGFAATRLEARDPLLRGFLAGVAVSSVVGVLQVADLSSPRPYPIPNRGPGLAEFTTVQSFNCAAALIVAAYFTYLGRSTFERAIPAVFGVACGVGLAVNGAQGGIYALAMVAAAVAFVARGRLRSGRTQRILIGAACLGVFVVVVPLALGVGVPSISGLGGDPEKGYGNEEARYDAAKAGVEELIDHPLTGPGAEDFHERHGEAMPHFLPLKAGVLAGVGGFLLGSAIVVGLVVLIARGPVGRSPAAWMGFAVLVVELARTLTTPDGPFGDTNSMVLFLVVALAAQGAEPVGEVSSGRDEEVPVLA
jgi:hypothetical protein